MSKTKLLSAIDFGLSQDNNGFDSLMFLLHNGATTGDVNYFGEWRPEHNYRSPFVGIEVFNTRPLNSEVPHNRKYVSIVNFHVYSTNQLKTGVIADRIQSLFCDVPFGANPSNWYFDFSNQYIQVESSQFVSRFNGNWNENMDGYEEVVQVRVIWTDYVCNIEPVPLFVCDCPGPVDGSPTGNKC